MATSLSHLSLGTRVLRKEFGEPLARMTAQTFRAAVDKLELCEIFAHDRLEIFSADAAFQVLLGDFWGIWRGVPCQQIDRVVVHELLKLSFADALACKLLLEVREQVRVPSPAISLVLDALVDICRDQQLGDEGGSAVLLDQTSDAVCDSAVSWRF